MNKHIYFTLALAVGIAGIAACGGSLTPNLVQPTVPTITTLPSDADMLAPKTLGSGPNSIVEYVSMSCTGCQTFHLTVVPQIKSQYVDTNRATLTLVSLFYSTESFVPAMLARCTGTAHFFDAVNTIFTNQSAWLNASSPDVAVEQVMLGFGMSQSVENSCIADTTLQNGLGAQHTAALTASYLLPDGTTVTGFTAVPAVVVNGVRLDGTDASGLLNSNFNPTLTNIAQIIASTPSSAASRRR